MSIVNRFTFKLVTTINSGLMLLTSIPFLVTPQLILEVFEVDYADTAAMQSLGRLFGITLLSLSLTLWIIKDLESSKLRRNFTVVFIIQSGLGFTITLLQQITNIVNVLHWPITIIYLLLTLAYTYFFLEHSRG